MITWKCSFTCNTLAAQRRNCGLRKKFLLSENNAAHCVCKEQTLLSMWKETEESDNTRCVSHAIINGLKIGISLWQSLCVSTSTYSGGMRTSTTAQTTVELKQYWDKEPLFHLSFHIHLSLPSLFSFLSCTLLLSQEKKHALEGVRQSI